MSKKVSRRNFLKLAASGSAAALALGVTPFSTRAFAQDSGELSFGFHWEAAFRPTQEEFNANFQDRHPDIDLKITYNTWGDHNNTVPIWAAAGTLPDIVYVHGSRAAPWAAEGIITDIDDLATGDAEFNVDDVWDVALDLYKPQGKIVAIPYDHGPRILGYNKDIFDAAGYTYPDDTWTMDDLKEAALALTDPDKGIWGWSGEYPTESVANAFKPWGADNMNDEETQLTYNTPEMLEAFTFWADMIHVDKIAPNSSEGEAFPSGPWTGGAVAMNFVASWSTPTLAEFATFSWDVAPWPSGVQRGVGAFGSGFGITNADNRDLSWTYLREYLSKEGMEFMWGASGRGSPARKAAYPAWVNSPIAPEHSGAFLDAMENHAFNDKPHKTLKSPELIDTLQREIALIKNGEKSVTEALATMQEDGQAILDS